MSGKMMAAENNINSSNKPHDAFFKKMMSHPKVRNSVLRSFLPKDLQKFMDWQQLQVCSTSFQTNLGKEFIADLVLKTKITESEDDAYIVLLLEHQSTPDERMPLRILEYSCEVMREHEKSHKNELPLVYPVVIYHGREPYHYPTDILDMIKAPEALVRDFFPGNFQLINLSEIEDEALKLDRWLASMALSLKHVFDRDVIAAFGDIVNNAADVYIQGEQQLCAIVVEYILDNADTRATDQIAGIIESIDFKPFKENVMTIAERLKILARAEGEARGEAKGKAEAKAEFACNLLNEGCAPLFIQKVTGLSFQEITALQGNLEKV